MQKLLKNKMKDLVKLLLTFISLQGFCQTDSNTNDYINNYDSYLKNTHLNKPSQWSFNDYTNMGNVDVSTGKFGLSVPVWDIKDENFSLPIGLSYSTSGLKINQNSTEVGMNWHLFSGGSISRRVLGTRDESMSYSAPPPSIGGTTHYEYAGSPWPSELGQFGFMDHFGVYNSEPTHQGSLQHNRLNNFNEFFPRNYNDGFHDSTVAQSIYEMLRTSDNKEMERDIFTFNVGNRTFNFAAIQRGVGTFLFDMVPLDDKGIKIEYEVQQVATTTIFGGCQNCQTEPVFSKFIITDKTGIKYYFEDYEIAENEYIFDWYTFPVDHTTGRTPWGFSYIQNASPGWDLFSLYNSKVLQHLMKGADVDNWYLSKIQLPNNKIISFHYTTDKFSEFFTPIRRHEGEYTGYQNNMTPKFAAGRFDRLTRSIHKKYINSILADDYSLRVYFYYSNQRPDYLTGGKNMTNIIVSTPNNKIIKQLNLSKQFSNADMEENFEDYRMFLSSIQEMNIDDRSNYLSNNTINNSYQFDYGYVDALPRKNFLPYTDLYSYYLGNRGNAGSTENIAFPKLFLYPSEQSGDRISYEPYEQTAVVTTGIDRRPTSTAARYLGALQNIIFPTKGSLAITYEPNTYHFEKGLNKSPNGPGIRVKQLNYIDSGISTVNKEYSYDAFNTIGVSSGNLLFKPSFAYFANLLNSNSIAFENSFNKSSRSEFYDYHRWGRMITYNILKQQGVSDAEIAKKMVVVTTNPIGPQADLLGREIIYKNIQEKINNVNDSSLSYHNKYFINYEDNSGIVHSVSGPSDEPSEFPAATYSMVWGESYNTPWTANGPGVYGENGPLNLKMSYGLMEKTGKNIYPFPDRNYFDMNNELLNGKIQKIERYGNSNAKVTSEEFTYEPMIVLNQPLHLLRNRNFNKAILPTHVYIANDPQKQHVELASYRPSYVRINDYFYRYRRGVYLFTDYKQYFERPVRLSSSKKTEFQPSGNLENTISYSYSPYTFNATVTESANSHNDKIKTEVSYISDILGSGGQADYSGDFIQRNMLSVPLITKSYRNGLPVEKVVLKYSKDWVSQGHEWLLQHKVISADLGTIETPNETFTEKLTFDLYDNKGNVLQYTKTNGSPISIVWGYNSTKPIAIIEGAFYSTISPFISEIVNHSDYDATESVNNDETDFLSKLDAFRHNSNFTNYQITTYTYDLQVGIRSVTPDSGHRESYIYDTANKLKKVIDHTGKTIKEINYNLKQ